MTVSSRRSTKGGTYFTASVRLYAHLLDESRACGSRENSDSDINVNMDEERSTPRGTDSRSVYPVHYEENGYSIQRTRRLWEREKKRKQSTETDRQSRETE